MENIFVRYSRKTIFCTDQWLYDKKHTVRGNRIYNEDDERVFELPYIPRHFHVLAFEFLVVDEESRIYTINRNTLEMTNVGQIEEGVMSISVSRDEKWCVAVSSTEMFIFDTYIDLKASVKVRFERFRRIEWTDYDLFAVMTETKVFFYDIELKKVAESAQDVYSGITWRSKYNVYACCTKDCIRFIEPNGLEHGEPLEEICDDAVFLDDGDTMATISYPQGILHVFYTKNFHWYRKVRQTIEGRLHSVEGNAILVKNAAELVRLYVFRERTHNESEYYVIDGASVLYTDFSEKIIPPPFCALKVTLDEQVVDIAPGRRGGIILHPCKLTVFEVEKGFTLKSSIPLDTKYDSVTLFKGFVLLTNGDYFMIRSLDAAGACVPAETMSMLEKYRSLIVRCYNFDERLCVVLSDGTVVYGNTSSCVDLGGDFEIHVGQKMIVHSKDVLKIAGEKHMEQVSSFLAYAGGMVVTTDQTCRFYSSSSQSCCQVDPGFRLLCMTGSKVIGETRHGTLETFTPRLYTLEKIKELLEAGEYKQAVEWGHRHAISFEIFLEYRVDVERFVRCCGNGHLISFFTEVAERLTGFSLVLGNERLRRLRAVFDSDAVIRGMGKDDFERLLDEDQSIDVEAFGHLLGHGSGGDRKYIHNCNMPNPFEEKSVCGRVPSRFLAEVFTALDAKKNLNAIIFLLVKLKRTDLALQVCRHGLREGVGYMMNITNVNGILSAAMGLFDEDLVKEVFRICQKDATDVLALMSVWKDNMLRFKICDFLENRVDAFYYLSRMQDTELEEEYLRRHGIAEEALMYEACGMSTKRKGFYYELCSGHFTPVKQLELLKLSGNTAKALETAVDNLFWREAVELYAGERGKEFYEDLVVRLNGAERRYEAARVIEEAIGDHRRAFLEYLDIRSMGDALRLCEGKDWEHLRREARNCLRERLCMLEDMKQSFVKYTQRLKTVEERVEDGLSETSFSYTQNIRKSKSTRLRDRPGGRYEREYVLDRIRTIGLDLLAWRDRNEDLLKTFERLQMEDCVEVHNSAFREFRDSLKAKLDEIFENERKRYYDPNRPVVEKPDLGRLDIL